MAVDKTRAYQRALALYSARTGRAPLDSEYNIIQDIVQAILEEIQDHFVVKSGIPVESFYTFGQYHGTTTSDGQLQQVVTP